MNKTKLKPILRKRRYIRQALRPANKLDPEGAVNEDAKVKQRKGLSFARPIQIIVVDPRSQYCKNVWCAIMISLVNVATGAVIMSVFQYSENTGDYHAIICCFAYHFFSAQAILSFHYSNGWSASMLSRHRRFAHIFLHLCGIVCAIVGTGIVIIDKEINTEVHGITGILTGILVLLNALVGLFALYLKKAWLKTCHITLGIPTFIMSSLCVCFGLIKNSFKSWASETVFYFLICLIIFYTVIIVTSSFMKCMSRM